MAIKRPKGTADIFGSNAQNFYFIEQKIRQFAESCSISEIRTPIFENSELFSKSIGSETDIVQKEMYNLTSRGGDEFTLRPEGTAPIVRAYIENSLYSSPSPSRLFYIAPCFRAERPQKGRLRQFHQFGVEFYGANSSESDAELISILWLFFEQLSVSGLKLKINSLGGKECRERYNQALLGFLNENQSDLCPMCVARAANNPMRTLDCKNESCINILKNAPITLDFLSKTSLENFESLKENLKKLEIPYELDSGLVRGLDYYNNTVFEVVSSDLGSQAAIAGGGRYDGLVEMHGGPKTPAIGFGLGIERLLIVLEAQGKLSSYCPKISLYIGTIDENSKKLAAKVAYQLRKNNISVEYDIMERSVKSQMKYADKINAEYTFILGENELKTNTVSIKNMQTGEILPIELSKIVQFFGE